MIYCNLSKSSFLKNGIRATRLDENSTRQETTTSSTQQSTTSSTQQLASSTTSSMGPNEIDSPRFDKQIIGLSFGVGNFYLAHFANRQFCVHPEQSYLNLKHFVSAAIWNNSGVSVLEKWKHRFGTRLGFQFGTHSCYFTFKGMFLIYSKVSKSQTLQQ